MTEITITLRLHVTKVSPDLAEKIAGRVYTLSEVDPSQDVRVVQMCEEVNPEVLEIA